ncbi:hypothetical protein HYT05_00315 [Candidatus Kaiserbacteria bacterium]|nr:hypothetical protein [Candidatus Kaiserbacteria bacterium]
MNIKWKMVVRDIAIILFLTFLGGFVDGFIGAATNSALVWSSFMLGTVGFAYSYYKTSEHRWPHLLVVAMGVWLVSLVNLIFFGSTIQDWFVGIAGVLIMLLAGSVIGAILSTKRM